MAFIFVMLSSAIIGLVVFTLSVIVDIQAYKQEAFDRGYMVECVGKVGYHWECDND